MKYLFFIFILFSFNTSSFELLKPSPYFNPKEVILIQLNALKNNNTPYYDAGIEQTWEFAHPKNKIYTGPLSNFLLMMHETPYSIMLEHLDHKVTLYKENSMTSYYIVEVLDIKGDRYRFNWIVNKVIEDGTFKNCWMTSSVSLPIPLSKSA